MSTPCYVSIEGLTQGNITADAFTAEPVGDIYVEGHEEKSYGIIQQCRSTAFSNAGI